MTGAAAGAPLPGVSPAGLIVTLCMVCGSRGTGMARLPWAPTVGPGLFLLTYKTDALIWRSLCGHCVLEIVNSHICEVSGLLGTLSWGCQRSGGLCLPMPSSFCLFVPQHKQRKISSCNFGNVHRMSQRAQFYETNENKCGNLPSNGRHSSPRWV